MDINDLFDDGTKSFLEMKPYGQKRITVSQATHSSH